MNAYFLLISEFNVRIANGTWGRVEVQHMGVWGSVCAGDSFNDSVANVICREKLGGRGGGVV